MFKHLTGEFNFDAAPGADLEKVVARWRFFVLQLPSYTGFVMPKLRGGDPTDAGEIVGGPRICLNAARCSGPRGQMLGNSSKRTPPLAPAMNKRKKKNRGIRQRIAKNQSYFF